MHCRGKSFFFTEHIVPKVEAYLVPVLTPVVHEITEIKTTMRALATRVDELIPGVASHGALLNSQGRTLHELKHAN